MWAFIVASVTSLCDILLYVSLVNKDMYFIHEGEFYSQIHYFQFIRKVPYLL